MGLAGFRLELNESPHTGELQLILVSETLRHSRMALVQSPDSLLQSTAKWIDSLVKNIGYIKTLEGKYAREQDDMVAEFTATIEKLQAEVKGLEKYKTHYELEIEKLKQVSQEIE